MEEKKLKTLKDHNRERLKENWGMYRNDPTPNGISCPICEKEMLDTSPMMVLTSIPPKKSVNCPFCNYKGFRIA